MHAHAAPANPRVHRIQQAVKWTVYTLLLINFAFYIAEDWERATHTLGPQSTWFDWTSEFATSIDESAWFLLLFLLELETYWLEDENWNRWVEITVRGIRLACIAMIAHTVVAWVDTVNDYSKTLPVENATQLCDLVDANVSYVYNLEYTEVTAETCQELSVANQFYWLGDGKDPLVVEFEGLEIERQLAWADLFEAVIWLVILLAIEVVVRLQDRGITEGTAMTLLTRGKQVLYLSLIGIAAFWGTLAHWLYVWDELLWIGGFAAIEMNVNQWRDELVLQAIAEA